MDFNAANVKAVKVSKISDKRHHLVKAQSHFPDTMDMFAFSPD